MIFNGSGVDGIVHSLLKKLSAPIHMGKAHAFDCRNSIEASASPGPTNFSLEELFSEGSNIFENKNIDLLWQIAARTELFCRGQSFCGRHQQFCLSFGGEAWLTYTSGQA